MIPFVTPTMAKVLRRMAIGKVRLPGLVLPPEGEKRIYLTFDDGPFDETTPRVLDMLARHGVAATFFLVGRQVEKLPAIAERMAREKHCIANHTYSHLRLLQSSLETQLEDIHRCQEAIAPYGAARIFRPTHGLMNPGLYRALRRQDFGISFWTLDSQAERNASPMATPAEILGRSGTSEILLMHDDSEADLSWLEQILAAGRSRGFTFGTLS